MNISFNWKEVFDRYRYPILILLSGLILLACGIIFWKNGSLGSSTKVEVLSGATISPDTPQLTVEIAGQVLKPGVYKMDSDSRVNDLLVISGGLTADADRVWVDKYLNKASKLTDGQKLYIPKVGSFDSAQDKQSNSLSANKDSIYQTGSLPNSLTGGTPVNINTASAKELDSLPGIGQTYAQNIIDHRPYSTLEELVSKGAIKQSLLNKIKDKITLY